MESLLYVGGFILFVLAGLRVSRVVNLMSFPLRTPDTEIVPMQQVPQDILMALTAGARELRRLGFELSHCSRSQLFHAGIKSPAYGAVYYHPEFNCYADLTINLLPDRDFPYQANFFSFFEGGLLFLTTNHEAYSIVDACPALIARDGGGLTLVEQLAAHCDGVAELESATDAAARMPRLSPEQFVEALRDSYCAYTDFLLKNGCTREDGDHYRLRPATAWQMAAQIIEGEKAAAKLLKRAAQENGSQRLAIGDREILTIEVDAYQRHDQVQENSSNSTTTKGVLLLVTILLFGVVFGISWSLQSVAILIGVILFHELGHILAMHLCGYRDLKILFIPFLGAAAMGKADNPRPWQKAFISLMGPLPGIVLGAVLAWQFDIGQNELLFELVVILLLVNFLNLLPIMPLDGGQLLNTALFSHHPRWEFGFYIVSLVLLSGWAALDRGSVLLVVAALLALQVPAQYRHMKLSLALMPAGSSGEQDPRRRVFRALGQQASDQQPFAVKLQQARSLVERLAQIRPTKLEAIACMAIYMMVLLSPLGFAGHWLLQEFSPHEVETDWDAEIAAIDHLPARLATHLDAAEDYMAAGDTERAFEYLDNARLRAESAQYQGEEYAEVLETIGSYALAVEWDATPVYQRLVELRESVNGRDSEEFGEANYLYAQYLSWNPETVQSALRYAAESVRARRLLDNADNTCASLVLLAQVEEQLGHGEAAETALQEAASLAGDASTPGLAYTLRSLLADLHVRQGRPARAVQELELVLAMPLEDYEILQARYQVAVVHILMGQGDEARTLLQQVYAEAKDWFGEDMAITEYSFLAEGSPHRHTMEIAVSYWAQGKPGEAQRALEQGARDLGDDFTELLARHSQNLNDWQQEADAAQGGISAEFNNLVIAMALDLGLTSEPRLAAE